MQRDRRRVALTAAGETFLQHARSILAYYDRALIETKRANLGDIDGLRLAFVPSTSHVIVPAILKRMRRQYPKVKFDLQEMSSERQIDEIARNKIDIGLLRPHQSMKEVEYRPLITEPFVMAVPLKHGLAGRRDLPLKSFAKDSFIMHSGLHQSGGTTLYSLSLDLLRQAGLKPRLASECSNHMHIVLGLVKADFGIALVPQSVMLQHIAGVGFATLKESSPRSEIGLAWRQGEENAVREVFVNAATETVLRLSKSGGFDSP